MSGSHSQALQYKAVRSTFQHGDTKTDTRNHKTHLKHFSDFAHANFVIITTVDNFIGRTIKVTLIGLFDRCNESYH